MATTLRSGSKAVTTAGTPVTMTSTVIRASWATIQSKAANVGAIYVGASSSIAGGGSGYTLTNPGDSLVLWPNGGPIIDLSLIYLDAATSGDGVDYLAITP